MAVTERAAPATATEKDSAERVHFPAGPRPLFPRALFPLLSPVSDESPPAARRTAGGASETAIATVEPDREGVRVRRTLPIIPEVESPNRDGRFARADIRALRARQAIISMARSPSERTADRS